MMNGALVATIHAWYRRLAAWSRRKTVTTVSCVLALTIFTYVVSRHNLNISVIPDAPIPVTVKLISIRHSTRLGLNKSTVTPTPRVFSSQKPPTSPQNHAMGRIPGQVSARGADAGALLPSQVILPNPGVIGTRSDPNSIDASLVSSRKSDTDKGLTKDKYYDIDSIPFDYGNYTKSYGNLGKTSKKGVATRYPKQNVTILTRVPPDLNKTSSMKITDKQKNYSLVPVNPISDKLIDYKTENESSWSSGPSRGQGDTLTDKEALVYDPEDVNLLAAKPFQLLKDYKNPCWSETVQTWYADNVYMEVENVNAVLTRMSAILRLRQERGDNHRIRCLPYFFIIGQPKCGSTDLYEKLMAHPEIIRPPTKEPHWWTRGRLGRHRILSQAASFADYIDLFDYAAYNIEQRPSVVPDTGEVYHSRITGEASMSTFWDNDHWWAMVGNENSTEPRVLIQHYIRHLLPGSKFVLILRNPSTRLYSDYLYFRKEIRVPQDFHNDVVNAIGVYKNCTRNKSVRHCVYNSTINTMAKVRLRVGMYSVFLEDWWKIFPPNQIYIVRTEDYATDPRTVLRGLYKFLGLNALSESHENQILARKKANTRRKEDRVIGDMLPETRTLLDTFYRPTNQQLATLLNDSRFLWEDTTPT